MINAKFCLRGAMKKLVLLSAVFLQTKAADISDQYKITFKDGSSGVYAKALLQDFGTIKALWKISEEEAQSTQFSAIDKDIFDLLYAFDKIFYEKPAVAVAETQRTIGTYSFERTKNLLLAAHFLDVSQKVTSSVISGFNKKMISPEFLQKFVSDRNVITGLGLPTDLKERVAEHMQNDSQMSELFLTAVTPKTNITNLSPNAFSSCCSWDSKLYAVLSYPSIDLYELESGNVIRSLQENKEEDHNLPAPLAFSPIEDLIASGSPDNTVKLWNYKTGELVKTLTEFASPVSALAFSPIQRSLTTASDNKIEVWNLETATQTQTFPHFDNIKLVVYSIDGKKLISASDRGQIGIWDLETGKSNKTQLWHKPINGFSTKSFAISQDRSIVAMSDNAEAQILNINTKDIVKVKFASHNTISSGILSIALSSQGAVLVGSTYNGEIKIFNSTTGKLIRILSEYKEEILKDRIFVSPNNKFFISENDRGDTLIKWDFNVEQLSIEALLLLHLSLNDSPEAQNSKTMVSPDLIKQSLSPITQQHVHTDLESYLTKTLKFKTSFWPSLFKVFEKITTQGE